MTIVEGMKAKDLVRTAYRVGTGEDIMSPPEQGRRTARLAFDNRSAALTILVLALVAGLLVGWTLSRPVEVHALPAAPTDTVTLPAEEPQAPVPSPLPTEPSTVTVYVSGMVNNPGIVELPQGSRVALAVEQAGGMSAEADWNALNLARVLVDGEHVVVPAPGEEVPAAIEQAPEQAAEPSSGLVNINSAGPAELETLPGVGPAIAQKIIDWRETNGPFSTVEELMEVSGIGPATLANLRDHVTT
ncbi:helix-hairpin-helix domain-containing protein [Flaviflexus huanghaiensis]|uniref:helix-hairpin-helix domain-containing protein n=1 Tax=Flaviflexus huanghaiensis TaxID=1111473 RepID=UPI0015FBC5D2